MSEVRAQPWSDDYLDSSSPSTGHGLLCTIAGQLTWFRGDRFSHHCLFDSIYQQHCVWGLKLVSFIYLFYNDLWIFNIYLSSFSISSIRRLSNGRSFDIKPDDTHTTKLKTTEMQTPSIKPLIKIKNDRRRAPEIYICLVKTTSYLS